jgi:hypothetical protein
MKTKTKQPEPSIPMSAKDKRVWRAAIKETAKEQNPPRGQKCGTCKRKWQKCICKRPGDLPFYMLPVPARSRRGERRELEQMVQRIEDKKKFQALLEQMTSLLERAKGLL